MAIRLYYCRVEWLKTGPRWRVEKALAEMGIDYELAPGPSRPTKREELIEHTPGRGSVRRSSSRAEPGSARSRRRWRKRFATQADGAGERRSARLAGAICRRASRMS
jgi:hypothetical protein